MVEYWAESDEDIEEDGELEGMNIPPPDISEVHEPQEQAKLHDFSMDHYQALSFSNNLTNRAIWMGC